MHGRHIGVVEDHPICISSPERDLTAEWKHDAGVQEPKLTDCLGGDHRHRCSLARIGGRGRGYRCSSSSCANRGRRRIQVAAFASNRAGVAQLAEHGPQNANEEQIETSQQHDLHHV